MRCLSRGSPCAAARAHREQADSGNVDASGAHLARRGTHRQPAARAFGCRGRRRSGLLVGRLDRRRRCGRLARTQRGRRGTPRRVGGRGHDAHQPRHPRTGRPDLPRIAGGGGPRHRRPLPSRPVRGAGVPERSRADHGDRLAGGDRCAAVADRVRRRRTESSGRPDRAGRLGVDSRLRGGTERGPGGGGAASRRHYAHRPHRGGRNPQLGLGGGQRRRLRRPPHQPQVQRRRLAAGRRNRHQQRGCRTLALSPGRERGRPACGIAHAVAGRQPARGSPRPRRRIRRASHPRRTGLDPGRGAGRRQYRTLVRHLGACARAP